MVCIRQTLSYLSGNYSRPSASNGSSPDLQTSLAMAIDPYANCNWSIPVANCTLATCCLVQSNFFYIPSYGGNIFFAIYFAMLLIPQLILGIYYKTWGYLVGLVLGLVLECIGYVARVQIHNSPFAANPFLM